MSKQLLSSKTPTMIIPLGTEIQSDAHGQLNIRTPGNLVIETSGHYGILESLNGSIRIEPDADVEAVQVRCAEACYVQGSLTAWKVSAHSLQLENQAKASIVLQDTKELSIGKGAQLVGNFSSEKELFVLFSRFAGQLKALPLFARRGSEERYRISIPGLTNSSPLGLTCSSPVSGFRKPITRQPVEARICSLMLSKVDGASRLSGIRPT